MIHALNVLHSHIREHAKRGTGLTHTLAQAITKEPPRSPHWPTVEHRIKKAHPACEACGSTKNVQVHHVKSFNDHPELELHDGTGQGPNSPLDPNPADGISNFICLCMDKNECHIRTGHGGSFRHGGFNPNVRLHAAAFLRLYQGGKTPAQIDKQAIWDSAAKSRIEETPKRAA